MSAIKKIFVSRSFDESFELGCEAEYEAISDVIKLLRHENISLTKAESSSSTPEEESLKKIKEADLVIFLLGRRYGTIYDQANNLSYIHAEYRKAVKENKKKLIYLFPLNEKDTQYEYCKKFREEVENPENRGHSKFAKIEDIVKTHDIAKEIIQLKRNDLGVSEKPSSGDIQAYCLFLGSKIKEDIEKEFLEEKKPLNLYSSVPKLPAGYYSRQEHINQIKINITKNKIVAVQGGTGVGKTTLAKGLGNDKELRELFYNGVYYVKIGQNCDLEATQCKLFYDLTGEETNTSLYKQKIEERFPEKALLILDDVWNHTDFEAFDVLNQETKSQILFTTRREKLLDKFNYPDLVEYKIDELSKEESLAILEKKIECSLAEMDPEFHNIADDILEKCGGSPLAIDAVANVLRGKTKDLDRWKYVSKEFALYISNTLAGEEHRSVFAAIQISVDFLKDKELEKNYFSLNIFQNSSFFNMKTVEVFWGKNYLFYLDTLTRNSLLLKQSTPFYGKAYTLHDLNKMYIETKLDENNKQEYRKQFIENYREECTSEWHKISPLEHGNFYHNYLEICQDLNEQNLAKEISEDILYNNPDISLQIVKKTVGFLELDLIQEAPKILEINRNPDVILCLKDYLDPITRKETFQKNITLDFHKSSNKKKFQSFFKEQEIKKVYENDTVIQGKVLKEIKGGLQVDIGGGFLAFLPNSQIDLKLTPNIEQFIGKTFDFKVLKYNKKGANIVISRKTLLEIDRLEKRAENLKKIKKGNIVKGIVKNITDYGVFVDIGGIDGLLHITDITWARITHPSEACAIGDEMEVMIIDFDLDKNRLSLGLKQKTADPWENIEKYKLGSIVTGKITNITAYGLFVELKKDVEGLVHNTELSWSKKITGIEDITQKVGDDIKVVVKEIDKDKRKISLSVKELTPNPWDEVAKTLKIDSVVEGVIQNVIEFGLFVTLPQGVDGLVHISDIDWNNRQQALIDLYKKGQKIRVKVISIDAKAERLALGIKQLKINPWIGIDKKLAAGDLVKGTVRYISEFGLFIETAEGVEGLLHINKMDSTLNSKEQLEKKYTIGYAISVEILQIEEQSQKLAFILPKSSKVELKPEEKEIITTNEGGTLESQENVVQKNSFSNNLN